MHNEWEIILEQLLYQKRIGVEKSAEHISVYQLRTDEIKERNQVRK